MPARLGNPADREPANREPADREDAGMVDVSRPGQEGEVWLPLPEGYAPLRVARRIGLADLLAVLRLGLADYSRHWRYGFAFGMVYVVAGSLLIGGSLALGWGHAIFPALSGFLLFGPFAALGLYEISRRREAGQGIARRDVFLAFRRHGGTQIALLGLGLVIATLFWFKAATLIYALYFGLSPIGLTELLMRALTTEEGLRFAVTGIAVGAVFAGAIFAGTVFAVPMLLDRDIDVLIALATSIKAVRDNAAVMLAWGALVSALMALGLLAGLIGLAVVLPILGHATWHLYARVLRSADGA